MREYVRTRKRTYRCMVLYLCFIDVGVKANVRNVGQIVPEEAP